MSNQKEQGRSHETKLTIKASPADVWKALTDPVELMRWFPLEADVRPGEGGSVLLSWGPEFTGNCRIEVWNPPRHLRTGWLEPHAGAAGEKAGETGKPTTLAVDYYVEGQGGSTVVRVVHSGFGSGAAWDKEYDGTRRGWRQELGSLRLYLERHRGKNRQLVWVRVPIEVSASVAWERLMSPQGLLAKGSLAGLQEHERFALTTASGDDLTGSVEHVAAPTDFAATIESMNDAYFRVAIEDCFGRAEAQLWLSVWGPTTLDLAALDRKWRGLLTRLFRPGE